MPGDTREVSPTLGAGGCRGTDAKFLKSPIITARRHPRFVEAGLKPGSLSRHSSLATGHSLKVSIHHEPNDRYHMNIRNRPVCPDSPQPFLISGSPIGISSG